MGTGVRTGDCAGPDLFMICILAVTSEMEWPEEGAPIFTDGRHEEYDFKYICFADDFFLSFETREALQDGLGRVIRRIQKMTGLSVHFDHQGTTGSKTVAMRCTPEGEYHHDIEWELDVVGAKKGYVQVLNQHRYLGTVVHFHLGSEAAIRARIRAARGALSKAVKVLRVKELDARVNGKLLVATIMNVLVHGSETWLIRAEDKLGLNTFWNDACRLAVGTTTRTGDSSGFTLKVIRRNLGVDDVDYYLRHRLLNWSGCMARMDQNQLPQRVFVVEAKVSWAESCYHNIGASKVNKGRDYTGSARGSGRPMVCRAGNSDGEEAKSTKSRNDGYVWAVADRGKKHGTQMVC